MTAKENATEILRASEFGALIIDGKAAAAGVVERVAAEAALLVSRGVKPGLAVVLVGADPASEVYVRSKGRAAEACGFHSVQHTLPATTAEADLIALVERLNADPAIHGILVQLPLPKHIDATKVLETIAPAKDVDGFHPVNAGLLALGERARALVPCTPAGCLILLQAAAKALGRELSGLDAIVVGRSNIVGKPMAQLLLGENCTVTIAHSRTRDLAAAVGRSRYRRCGDRPAGDDCRRVDQAGRASDRCRHQSRGRAGGRCGRPAEDPPRGRCRFRGGRPPCGGDHAGAGRRRADDHRHADVEYADRGATPARVTQPLAAGQRHAMMNMT